MTYEVKINLPNTPDLVGVEIPGLGLFENGSTVQVDDDRAHRFYEVLGLEVDTELHFREGISLTKVDKSNAPEYNPFPEPEQPAKDVPPVSTPPTPPSTPPTPPTGNDEKKGDV